MLKWCLLRSFAVAFSTACVLLFLGGDAALGDTRQEYLELAKSLSQEFKINGVPGAEAPQPATLERLTKSSEPAVKGAAGLLLQGLKTAEKEKQEAQQRDENSRRQAAETLAAIDRGEYQRKVEYYDVDAQGNLQRREYTVDDSLLPYLFSWSALNRSGEPTNPALEATKLRIATDRARASAWEQAAPKLAERFAGPPTRVTFITLEHATSPAGTVESTWLRPAAEDMLPGRQPFAGRFIARNMVNRDLHNVTLAVDFCHYSTLPEATLRHVYFIPLWKKDAVVELSRTFALGVKGASKYDLEITASSNDEYTEFSRRLEAMSGIVELRSTVWCDEARQATTKHPLPGRSNEVAKTLLQMAEKCISRPDAVTNERTAPRPPGAKYDPPEVSTQKTLDRILPPLFNFVSADSEFRRRGERILKDFPSVRKELMAGADRELLAACGAGQLYQEEALNSPGPGRLGILFLSCDAEGKRIRAEIFQPRKPEERRLLAGFIAEENSQRWIYLEPLVPSDKTARDIPSEERTHSLTHAGLRSFRFQLKDGKLIGQSSEADLFELGRQYSPHGFQLVSAKVDDRTLTDALARERAAPQAAPRLAVASIPLPQRTGPMKPTRTPNGDLSPLPDWLRSGRAPLGNNTGRPQNQPRPAGEAKNGEPKVEAGDDPYTVTVDDVEYTFAGARKSNNKVIVSVTAKSRAGVKEAPQEAMIIMDASSRRYASRSNRAGSPVKLKEGVPVKLTWEFGGAGAFGGSLVPLPEVGAGVEFSSVSVGGPRGQIVFRNVGATGKK